MERECQAFVYADLMDWSQDHVHWIPFMLWGMLVSLARGFV
jgi:hypothetical protein